MKILDGTPGEILRGTLGGIPERDFKETSRVIVKNTRQEIHMEAREQSA